MNVSSDLTQEPGFELYMTVRLKPSQEKTIDSHTNKQTQNTDAYSKPVFSTLSIYLSIRPSAHPPIRPSATL